MSKGGDIDALLVGIFTEFELLFELFEGIVATVDGDFTSCGTQHRQGRMPKVRFKDGKSWRKLLF